MSKLLITISREYGSGGLLVGQELAEALGLPCYDKKLLTIAAEKSGFSEEMLRQPWGRRLWPRHPVFVRQTVPGPI